MCTWICDCHFDAKSTTDLRKRIASDGVDRMCRMGVEPFLGIGIQESIGYDVCNWIICRRDTRKYLWKVYKRVQFPSDCRWYPLPTSFRSFQRWYFQVSLFTKWECMLISVSRLLRPTVISPQRIVLDSMSLNNWSLWLLD